MADMTERVYRFDTPRRHGPHFHPVQPATAPGPWAEWDGIEGYVAPEPKQPEPSIDCARCRREAWANFEAEKVTYKASVTARGAYKATRVQNAAGAIFGILGLSFPVWAIAGLTGAGPMVLVMWAGLMVVTFIVSEGRPRSVEPEPKPSLFAVTAYVLDHPPVSARRVAHLVEADNVRRTRRERAAAERRGAAMRSVADAAALAQETRGGRVSDDLPWA